ncbi:hypothetical protein KR018_007926, partial [Drosophila ironensis]
MRNNKADNTQRQKLGLNGKRRRQRRVWKSAMQGTLLASIQEQNKSVAILLKRF